MAVNKDSSVAQSRPTLCDPMDCSMPGLPVLTNSRSLLKLMSIESVMPSNHLILCRPFLLRPSIFPSIRIFSSESAVHIKWPKYWSFSFSISSSNEYRGLISFRVDYFDLLAVQGTLKSLLQHHNSKTSIFQPSVFLRRRQWQPTPIILPGNSHGWRSLVGCSPWGRKELDTTEWLHFHFSPSCTGEGNGNPLQHSSLENPRVRHNWSDLAAEAATVILMVQLSHPYMTSGKKQLWLYGPLLTKWCLCFLMHYIDLPYLSFQGSSVF